jgi:phosphoribosylformimino-5-aminoimidazole carboxamide ribotide isomerase
MIAIPAVDIRDGCCVQLVGGSFADERVRIPDPVAAARRWMDAGFSRLHVVDLDAAMGAGSNADAVSALLELDGVETRIGGGIRTTARARELLGAGASKVVVGTRAMRDREWLSTIAREWPGRVIVAADTRDGEVVVDGWRATEPTSVERAIEALNDLPLAGFLVTAVEREGRMVGPSLELIARVVTIAAHPVIASGGIGSMDDLAALDRCGASAAVIGMALYAGTLDARVVAREFAQ